MSPLLASLSQRLIAMTMLPLLLTGSGCVQKQVWLVPEEGPLILGETIRVDRIGIEDPPGSGKILWIDGQYELKRGLTVLRYDWTRKVESSGD